MAEHFYKFLDPNRAPMFVSWQWPEPGVWAPEVEDVVMCARGYHACTADRLIPWAGPELWEVEYDGPILRGNDKVVGGKARLVRRVDRWNETVAMLLAADFAEGVLHIFETEHPNDSRPREAIEMARLFAVGEATYKHLVEAGEAAKASTETLHASSGRPSASWYAAWAAVSTCSGTSCYYTVRTASSDALAAVGYAAATSNGRWDAASRTAYEGARQRQAERLIHYTGITR